MNTFTWCFSVLILATAQQLTDATYSSADFANVSVSLCIGSSIDVDVTVKLSDAGSLFDHMDKSKPVAIVICELGSGLTSESILKIKDGYQKRGDHNLVLIESSTLGTNVLDLNACLSAFGGAIAVHVDAWLKAGLLPANVHIVGFAHGYYIAVSVCANLPHKIATFIGLDALSTASGISVELFPSRPNVNHSRCMLTDAGVWAVSSCNCDVIYLPNNGCRQQPGCLPSSILYSYEDSCSHRRSYEIYGETMCKPDLYKCRKCSSWAAFILGLCSLNEIIVVGLGTPNTASGLYYMYTNPTSPYGMGDAGC